MRNFISFLPFTICLIDPGHEFSDVALHGFDVDLRDVRNVPRGPRYNFKQPKIMATVPKSRTAKFIFCISSGLALSCIVAKKRLAKFSPWRRSPTNTRTSRTSWRGWTRGWTCWSPELLQLSADGRQFGLHVFLACLQPGDGRVKLVHSALVTSQADVQGLDLLKFVIKFHLSYAVLTILPSFYNW